MSIIIVDHEAAIESTTSIITSAVIYLHHLIHQVLREAIVTTIPIITNQVTSISLTKSQVRNIGNMIDEEALQVTHEGPTRQKDVKNLQNVEMKKNLTKRTKF